MSHRPGQIAKMHLSRIRTSITSNYNIIRLFDLWGLKTEPIMSFHVLAQVTISTQGSVGRNPSFRSQKFVNEVVQWFSSVIESI